MRLLHANTSQLCEFPENKVPPYAILSHTWEDDEVLFRDMQEGHAKNKRGYIKIKLACEQAISDELEYVWVDTCCIDKSSSAELSEAINSMFRWYRDAEICYVYLADIAASGSTPDDHLLFPKSRWFTRGWTLQELIAPAIVSFYSNDWTFLGTKHHLTELISKITGIEEAILTGGNLDHASVAKKMSWASRRVTTRTEDIAYCLLGIFGVNMPLIYGEGEKAFLRLQEEIIKESDDQSLLAWGLEEPDASMKESDDLLLSAWGLGLNELEINIEELDDQSLFAWGLEEPDANPGIGVLAPSPFYFATAGDIIPCKIWKTTAPHSMTSKGLRIDLPVRQKPLELTSDPVVFYGVLSCHRATDFLSLLEIPIRKIHASADEYIRSSSREPSHTQERYSKTLQPKSIYIHRSPPFIDDSRRDKFLFRFLDIFDPDIKAYHPLKVSHRLHEVYPRDLWDDSLKVLSPRIGNFGFIPTIALLHFRSETEQDFVIIVEYIPVGYYGSTEVSQARCVAKPMPENMTFQQILSWETTFDIHERNDFVPLNKRQNVNSIHTYTVKLKKEEVMGIEMFVVDFGIDISSSKFSNSVWFSTIGKGKNENSESNAN